VSPVRSGVTNMVHGAPGHAQGARGRSGSGWNIRPW